MNLVIESQKMGYSFLNSRRFLTRTAFKSIEVIQYVIVFVWDMIDRLEKIMYCQGMRILRLAPLESIPQAAHVVSKDRRFSMAKLYSYQRRLKRMCLDINTNWKTKQIYTSFYYISNLDAFHVHKISAST